MRWPRGGNKRTGCVRAGEPESGDASVEVVQITSRDAIDGQQNEYIGGTERLIDDRAVTDECAKAEVSLDKRRQAAQCLAQGIGVRRNRVHRYMQVRDGTNAIFGRCQMVFVEIAQSDLMLLRISPRKAGASEHDINIEGIEVAGNPPPEKLNGGMSTIRRMNAAPPQLEKSARPPGSRSQWCQIIFPRGVEPATAQGHFLSQQAIGSDDGFLGR